MTVPSAAPASVSQARPANPAPPPAPTAPASAAGHAHQQWYYCVNGQKYGPVPAEELARLANDGKLKATDLVWTNGLQEWVPASSIEDLPFSSSQVPPPIPRQTAYVLDDPGAFFKGFALRLWQNKRAFWMTVSTAIYLFLVVLLTTTPAEFIAYFLLTDFYILGMVSVFIVTRSPAAKLLGKWESKASGHLPALTVEFLKDGSLIVERGCTDTSPIMGQGRRAMNGTYRLHEDKTLEITLGNPPRKLTERVVSVPDWTKPYDLVLTFEGETRTFKQWNPVSKSLASWFSDGEDKKEHLFGRWEPMDGEGAAIQFTKDGAFIRAGGLVAKYRLGQKDTIEVYADDAPAVLTLQVLSLSKQELAFRADGQGYHYRRVMTFTEAVEQQQWEKTKETMKTVAKGAGVVAAGAIIALGAAAVFAAAASTPCCPWCRTPLHGPYCPYHGLV